MINKSFFQIVLTMIIFLSCYAKTEIVGNNQDSPQKMGTGFNKINWLDINGEELTYEVKFLWFFTKAKMYISVNKVSKNYKREKLKQANFSWYPNFLKVYEDSKEIKETIDVESNKSIEYYLITAKIDGISNRSFYYETLISTTHKGYEYAKYEISNKTRVIESISTFCYPNKIHTRLGRNSKNLIYYTKDNINHTEEIIMLVNENDYVHNVLSLLFSVRTSKIDNDFHFDIYSYFKKAYLVIDNQSNNLSHNDNYIIKLFIEDDEFMKICFLIEETWLPSKIKLLGENFKLMRRKH